MIWPHVGRIFFILSCELWKQHYSWLQFLMSLFMLISENEMKTAGNVFLRPSGYTAYLWLSVSLGFKDEKPVTK